MKCDKTYAYDTMTKTYPIAYISFASVGFEKACEIANIFRFSNPQFFFLYNGYTYSKEAQLLGLCVYPEFAEATKRSQCKGTFKQEIQKVVSDIELKSTVWERIKEAHRYVVTNTTYDKGKTGLHQSAYGVFCQKKAVCAGYAQATALLLNAVNIEAIQITSVDHQWNMVLVDGNWYHLDSTFDDPDIASVVYYDYFMRSDVKVASNHKPEKYWESYLPKAVLDSGAVGTAAGTQPTVTQKVSKPTSSWEKSGDKMNIKFDLPEGAEMFYSIDPSEPFPQASYSRFNFYKNGVKISKAGLVRYKIYVPGKLPYDGNERFGDFKVTLNPVGGTIQVPALNITQYSFGNTTALPKGSQITKKGYEFKAWYKDSTYKGTGITSISSTTMGDLDLYAKWAPITYKVVYKSNGGSGTMSASTFTYDQVDKLRENAFKKTGYYVASWNTEPDGSGKSYSPEANVMNLLDQKGATLTLYAQWKLATYNVNYHLAGGTFDGSKYYKPTFQYTTDTFELQPIKADYGYKFAGWYKDPAFKTPISLISKGTASDVDVYAKIVPCTYTMKFHAFDPISGDIIDCGIPDKTCYYSEVVTLPVPKNIVPGYEFNKWEIHTTQIPSSSDKIAVNNLSYVAYPDVYTNGAFYNLTDKNGVIHFYAVLTNEYKISLNPDGGSVSSSNITANYNRKVTLPVPEKLGYTFLGWDNVDTEKVEKLKTYTQKNGYNVSLKAVWSENSYVVTYVGNEKGVMGKTPSVTVKYSNLISSLYLPGCGYSVKGKKFDSWNLVSNPAEAVGHKMKVGESFASHASYIKTFLPAKNKGKLNIYAQWTTTSYLVTYNLNGGTQAAGAVTSYYYNNPGGYALPVPTKTDCTFNGWYSDQALTKKVSKIAQGDYGDKVFYAKWTLNNSISTQKATVTFDANGGYLPGNVTNKGYTYYIANGYSAADLAKIVPLDRDGYTFGGWYKERECKHKVTSIPAKFGGNTYLYAKWIGKKYTVYFEANAPYGTKLKGKVGKITCVYGNEYKLKKCGYSVLGYGFNGWALTPSSTTKYGDQGIFNVTSYPEDGVLTLYGRWTKIQYTIDYYNITEAEKTKVSNPYKFGAYDGMVKLKDPERQGYTFLGWYTNAKCSGSKVTYIKAETAKDYKLYAKWKLNTNK